jgi:hypothetical protein
MSMTEQSRTPNAARGNDADGRGHVREVRRSTLRETKPSPKTTELWLTIVGVVVLAVVYNASRDASLNLFRACLLGTVMVAAYIVSRGFAKAGSHDDDDINEYERRA